MTDTFSEVSAALRSIFASDTADLAQAVDLGFVEAAAEGDESAEVLVALGLAAASHDPDLFLASAVGQHVISTALGVQAERCVVPIDSDPTQGTNTLPPFADERLTGGILTRPVGQGRLVVAASADGDVVWLEVEPTHVTEVRSAAGTTLHRLSFDGAPGTVVARGDDAAAPWVDLAWRLPLLGAAQLVGLGRAALDRTLAYVTEREAFGQPVGAQQAVKHRCADMAAEVAAGEALTWSAARMAGRHAPPAAADLVHGAKGRTSATMPAVISRAVLLHGAVGFTEELGLGAQWRKAVVLATSFGTSAAHRESLTRSFQSAPEAALEGFRVEDLLDLDEEQQRLLAQAREWLQANTSGAEWTSTGFFDVTSPERADEMVVSARAWEARKQKAGWIGLDLPQEWGGRGRSRAEATLFSALESHHKLPLDVFSITRGMVIPTLVSYGRGELAHEWVESSQRGEMLWCQLFSEPDCGSDLAGIRTAARRDGEDWVIEGQKVWTSRAQFADAGLLLARTSTEDRRHEGLTMFVLPMDEEGVTVRPIPQVPGSQNFCEVFLDGVRLPDSHRVGEAGAGFRIALHTLGHERVALTGKGIAWKETVEVARALPASAVADFVELWLSLTGLSARQLQALAEGAAPGPEGSVMKLLTSRAAELSHELVMAGLGARALEDSELLRYAMGTWGARIGGGTEEIQRNTIAERLLGLPRHRS